MVCLNWKSPAGQRNGNLFFKIHESNEFNPSATGAINPCQQLSQGNDYTVGLMKKNEDVFESKILGLIGNYSSNYKGLKSQLKVPDGREFDFSFIYGNGTKISTNKNWTISSSINVYAKDISIEYISKNASKESGSINVKMW